MISIKANEEDLITGLCADCIFVAAKCADNGVEECPYFAKDNSAMCEANSNAVLAEVPTMDEIKKESEKYDNELSSTAEACWMPQGFIEGANWAIKEIKKRNQRNFT